MILGDWSDEVCSFLTKYLSIGNVNIKNEIYQTILNGKNPQYTNLVIINFATNLNINKFLLVFSYFKSSPALNNLIKTLEDISKANTDSKMALEASICIGKLGIKESTTAINRLIAIMEDSDDWESKSKALETLVRLFDYKNSIAIRFIINQIDSCNNWVARA